MRRYAVALGDQPKGEVVYEHGRWWWWRRLGGVTTYPRGSRLDTVRADIARLCRVSPADLTFTRDPG